MDSRFISIIRKVAELSPDFILDANLRLLEDVGIDSLKLIDIVLSLESQFGVELAEDDLTQIATVGDLWRAVAAQNLP